MRCSSPAMKAIAAVTGGEGVVGAGLGRKRKREELDCVEISLESRYLDELGDKRFALTDLSAFCLSPSGAQVRSGLSAWLCSDRARGSLNRRVPFLPASPVDLFTLDTRSMVSSSSSSLCPPPVIREHIRGCRSCSKRRVTVMVGVEGGDGWPGGGDSCWRVAMSP